MKFAEATKLHRKSGVWGTLRVSCGRELPGDREVEGERPQIPPLRYAPVGMTKGRVVSLWGCVFRERV
jgi:hypothetical protein